MLYRNTRDNILKSAAKMPPENYAFKPAPEVRSFAAMLGHIADSQYRFCGAASGQMKPAPGVEKSQTTKEGVIAGLKESFAFCDAAYDSLTDASALEKVKWGQSERHRLFVLHFNAFHIMEHYGNIVTYLRIKGIVPPSSE